MTDVCALAPFIVCVAQVVFSKVFIDQVLWNPIFGVMFFSYVGLMEAKGVAHVVDKVKNDLLTSVTGSWKVWPLAHTINFRFIPSNQRVLYINTIQVCEREDPIHPKP